MKIVDLVTALNLKVFSGAKGMNNEVSGAYVSDLLSDVMGNADKGELWITLQTHKNIMAVASLKELPGVILVKGLVPDRAAMEKSDEENIPLLGTDEETFRIAGRLYEILIA
ncbi:MAG: DRTGG domain-containing protein [bacterium]